MSCGDPPREYRLAPRALDDLDDIWRYSADTWSIEQADRYVDGLVRLFEAIAEDHVAILRLLGGRQDWASVLKAADP